MSSHGEDRTYPDHPVERPVDTTVRLAPGEPEPRLTPMVHLPRDQGPRAVERDDPGDPNRYRSVQELGRGAMGVVELVEDTLLGRRVALKSLAAPGPANLHRFLREARITAQLEHPGIVPVHDLGRDATGRWSYAMKRIRGETLLAALKRCATLDDRLRLLGPFVAMCHAVGYAHGKGVVHRDLKPANMMLGAHGEALVLDWGIAKVVGDADDSVGIDTGGRDRLTRPGTVMGTLKYMSPEQARGELDQIGPWSDVWSLGCVLFELLTGEPYLKGTPKELLARLVDESVPDPDAALAKVPRELVAILRKALRTGATQRYANAADLARDLEAWRAGALVAAHDYTAREQLQRLASRNRPTLFGAAAVAVAVGIALLSSAAWFVPRGLAEQQQARAALEDARWEQLVTLGRELGAAGATTEAVAFLRAAEELRPGDPRVEAARPAQRPTAPPADRTDLRVCRGSFALVPAEPGGDPVWGGDAACGTSGR